MTLHTVSIAGVSAPIEVYGGEVACDDYLVSSSSPGAVAYQALDAGSDARRKLLIDATRYIDRQRWLGTRNADGGTTLAFPRDDLKDLDGTDASNAEQLALVERATFEMVAVLAADASTYESADTGSNIKAMGAGSARLEFWGPTSARAGTASKLPTAVQDLIGHWLAGTGSVALTTGPASAAGSSSGTCGNSYFDRCDSYRRSGPF